MNLKLSVLGLTMAASLKASAALYTSTTPVAIPDNSTIGTGGALSYTASGLNWSISDVVLKFNLQGGYAGDLSGYLRLGNTSGSPAYDLTSLIRGQTLNAGTPTSYTIDFTTGGFQTKFEGLNPNDTWTLFFADSGFGATTTVTGWSLDVTAVPEPVNVALGVFGSMMIVTGILKLNWRRIIKFRLSRQAEARAACNGTETYAIHPEDA
jgi:hypothetical protein